MDTKVGKLMAETGNFDLSVSKKVNALILSMNLLINVLRNRGKIEVDGRVYWVIPVLPECSLDAIEKIINS